MKVIDALKLVEKSHDIHKFVLHDAISVSKDKLAELRLTLNNNGMTSAKMSDLLGGYTEITVETDTVQLVDIYGDLLSRIIASVIGYGAGFGLMLDLDADNLHNAYYYDAETKTMAIYSEGYWTYALGLER